MTTRRNHLLIAVAAVILVVAGIGSGNPAHAAASVQVTAIDCARHPQLFDLVYITNNGDAAQDLAGWQLRSDPEASQQMSLTQAGILDPGEQIVVAAGAHGVSLPNEGLYLWTNDEVLRDSGDPPDYVRLLDAAGKTVGGLNCNGGAWDAPTAPAPTAAPAQPAAQNSSTAPATASQGQTAGAAAVQRTASGPRSVPAAGGRTDAGGPIALVYLGLAALLAGTGLLTIGMPWRIPAAKPLTHRGGEGEASSRAPVPPDHHAGG